MKAKLKNHKLLLGGVAIAAVALLGSGVFAATQITLNSGNAVNLGAGTAAVNVCGNQATVAAQQTLISNIFKTTTVSITGVSSSTCAGKILSLAFAANGVTNVATWTINSSPSATDVYSYGYGSNGGACSGSPVTCQAQTALTAFDTANSNWTTVAVAAQ